MGDKPDPINAARAMFFTGEARNAQGMWQLGQKNTFVCTSAAQPTQDCHFNALDDQQERARYGLLDWNVRINLRK
jgi:hypothetical protein